MPSPAGEGGPRQRWMRCQKRETRREGLAPHVALKQDRRLTSTVLLISKGNTYLKTLFADYRGAEDGDEADRGDHPGPVQAGSAFDVWFGGCHQDTMASAK